MSRLSHLSPIVAFAAALGFVAFSWLFQSSAVAQGTATLDPNEAKQDADFPFLGEFVGPIETQPGRYERFALQIRPVGDGNFEAIQFWGGLPGEKPHDPKPTKLIALRSTDFLVLSGGPYALVVHPDRVVVVDRDGNRIGWLERIKRQSPTLGAAPPEGATVLFDGTGVDLFKNATLTEDGLLTEGAEFKLMFQDFNLHLEFMVPYKPLGRGQDRGNSGVYLQSRYEVQILDSFATIPVIDGCGALYKFRQPDLNMAYVPLQWQTYDIVFTAARWASDPAKVRNARITVWLNGVKVQDDVELPSKTGAGEIEEPTLKPTKLQDHGNPVRYRNIWLIDRGLAQVGPFPVMGSEVSEEKPAPEQPADPPESQDQEPTPEAQPAPDVKPEGEKEAEPAAGDAEPTKEEPALETKTDESKPEGNEAAPIEQPAPTETNPAVEPAGEPPVKPEVPKDDTEKSELVASDGAAE